MVSGFLKKCPDLKKAHNTRLEQRLAYDTLIAMADHVIVVNFYKLKSVS
jgi:hypothetical protein